MTNNKKPSGEKVIHLKFTSGGQHYFGSIAAIYDLFSADTLGITQQSLYDYGVTPDNPYKNKVCTIYEGAIKRKKGNRKLPKQKTDYDEEGRSRENTY